MRYARRRSLVLGVARRSLVRTMLQWGKIKTGLNSFSTNTACNLEVVAMVMATKCCNIFSPALPIFRLTLDS